MYKLIIVDDEELICRGLSELIEWAEMGFEVSAILRDGSEAIEYLKKEAVDVVLTDIRMKNISGLEVAKFVNDNLQHTKVVIISGYREFEYAKKAVEYNVVHYLLKPTQFDEVDAVFKQLKQELDIERNTENETALFKERYKELIPILQEQFFIDLLMGALRDEDEIKRRIAMLNLPIDPYKDLCCLISFDLAAYKKFLKESWEYGRERLDVALNNFFNAMDEEVKYYTILNYENVIKVIALSSKVDNVDEMTEAVQTQLDKLTKTIQNVMGLYLDLRLEQCLENIIKISNYKVNYVDMLIQDTDDKLVLEPDKYMHLINKYKLFMSIIYDGDIIAMNSLVDSFVAEMEVLPLKAVHHMIINMFAVLTKQFMEMGTDIWGITGGKADYLQIVNMKHLDSIKKWCKNIFSDIIKHINNNVSSNNLVDKALIFMKNNYQQDISLDDVADQVFLNPVYFSRLFKQQVGENFTDCLTKIRMDRALELLKEKRYKAYEVSEMVGYSNCKYFTRVFKQYTGYTTTEYLKLLSEWGA